SRDAATPACCERLPPTERAAICEAPLRVLPIWARPTCAPPKCALPTCAALNPPPPRAPKLIPPLCPPNPRPRPPEPPTCPPSPPTHTAPAPATSGARFECEKRRDAEQRRSNASASSHRAAGPAPHRRGRLRLGILPRTKSF